MWLTGIVTAIVIIAVYLVICNSTNSGGKSGEISTNVSDGTSTSNSGISGTDGPKGGIVSSIDPSRVTPVSVVSQQEISKLQELLDDEDKHEEALKQALKMSREGDADQILSALDAFRWLGGREAKIALVELIKNGGDISSRAIETLQSIFQTDVVDDDRDFDVDIWLDAFNALPDDAEREAFLILLTSNPPDISAPALIQLWQATHDNDIKDMLKEYFEGIAEGEEILNVEDARKWFDAYKREQENNDNEDEE